MMAIADHPWTKATKDAASVRIAMTVVESATHGKAIAPPGRFLQVVRESGLDSDDPIVDLIESEGTINSDLSIGVDVTQAKALRSNDGISSNGMMLAGSGFIVTIAQAELLGLNRREGLENHIRPYRNGRDLTSRARNVFCN